MKKLQFAAEVSCKATGNNPGSLLISGISRAAGWRSARNGT